MRVVFMGTPAFAVPSLEALANSDHEVVRQETSGQSSPSNVSFGTLPCTSNAS